MIYEQMSAECVCTGFIAHTPDSAEECFKDFKTLQARPLILVPSGKERTTIVGVPKASVTTHRVRG